MGRAPGALPRSYGSRRGRGTLVPGTPVPPRAGTVFPNSDRPPRFPRGGATPPRGGAWGSAPETGAPPRRRGACSFCGHLGHWVWECPAQSPEVLAHDRALCEAVAAYRNGRGPAPPAPLLLGAGPPVAPLSPTVTTNASGPPGTATFVHAVETSVQAYPDAAGNVGESSFEEWAAGAQDAEHGDDRPCHAQGTRERASPLSRLPTDVVRLKAHRHCYITVTRLCQVRKRRAAAGFPLAPAFCPCILARPGKGSSAAAEVLDRPTVPAAPESTKTVPPPPRVAASVLTLGHSDPRPCGVGDDIPADTPANGA